MKTKIFMLALVIMLASSAALSEIHKIGPYPNYSGVRDERGIIIDVPTVVEFGIIDPFTGEEYWFGGWGGQHFEIHYTVPLFAASYYEYETPFEAPFDPETSMIKMIEVFSKSLQPILEPDQVPELGGFDPTEPEVEPSGIGYFKGQSGTIYTGTLTTNVSLYDLPTQLPGYDVSKFTGDPDSHVHILEANVPASDFPAPMEFEFEYLGYVEYGDPDWVGPPSPEHPYQHTWELNITRWDFSVEKITDLEVDSPTYIVPGYLEIIPPENWEAGPWFFARYGYEANEGYEITNADNTLQGWKVNGKTPYVVPGEVYLTEDGVQTSSIEPTFVVADESNTCGDWGYLDSDVNLDCKVDLVDVAVIASEWLACTEPGGTGCVHETITGLGFAFNPEDTTGPATIVELYDDTYSGQLEPNDIIVEYRDISISCGKNLATVINGLPDLIPTEIVSMDLKRQGTDITVDLPAIEISVEHIDAPSGQNMDCKEIPITPSGKSCQCVNGSAICICGRDIKRDKETKKMIKYRWRCADTNGGECVGDWFFVK